MAFQKRRKGKNKKAGRNNSSLSKAEKNKRRNIGNAPSKVHRTDTLPSASSASAAMAASAAVHVAASAACPAVVDTNMQPFRSLTLEELDQMEISFSQNENQAYCRIAYYKRFGMPDESDWRPLIEILVEETGLHEKTIRKYFNHFAGDSKEEIERKKGSGRKSKLDKKNRGLLAAALLMNFGASPAKAVHVCNKINKEEYPDEYEEKKKISASTLVRTLKKYATFEKVKTLRRKTGSRDVTAPWAVTRTVQSTQFLEQLELGEKMDREGITWETIRKDYEITPIWSDGILSVDEGHCKAMLSGGHTGSTNSLQYRIAINPETKELATQDEGGILPERKVRVKPKYSNEARGAYGVAVTTVNGERKVRWMSTFNYTIRKLVSIPKFGSHKKSEQSYRRGSDYRGWKDFRGENPYEERYGQVGPGGTDGGANPPDGEANPQEVDLYTGEAPEDGTPEFRLVPFWEYMLLNSPKMRKYA